MKIEILKISPLIALCTAAVLMGGCSDPDDSHAATNTYATSSAYIIKGNPGTAFEYNEYSFFIRMEAEPSVQDSKMVFLLSGLSRNSDPDVHAFLDQARFIMGDKALSPFEKSDVFMRGKVNTRNGETLFDEIKLSFPYDAKMHWGEKLNDSNKKDLATIGGFSIVVPVSVPVFDNKPAYQKEGIKPEYKVHNVVFTYRRDERPGDPYIKFGSW